MNKNSQKISGAYKAVIALNIFLLFFDMVLASLTHSKVGGGAIFIGYSIWLMFNQRNERLVALYRFALWFIGFGFISGSLFFLFSKNAEAYLNLSYRGLVAELLIAGLINFLMYRFFRKQIERGSNKSKSPNQVNLSISDKELQNDDQFWEVASEEFDSPARKKGLWAKCFAESGGEEGKAKARYLEIRFEELSKSSPSIHLDSMPLSNSINDVVEDFSGGENKGSPQSSKAFIVDQNKFMISQRGKPKFNEKNFTFFYVFLGFVIFVIICSIFTSEDPVNKSYKPTTELIQFDHPYQFVGRYHTGIYENCCINGVSTKTRYSYVDLAQTMDIESINGTQSSKLKFNQVQLALPDADKNSIRENSQIQAWCENILEGNTGHYALKIYCSNPKIRVISER